MLRGSQNWNGWSRRPWRQSDEPGTVLWVQAGTTVATGFADLSFNGRHLVNSNATKRPTVANTTPSGLPAMVFDGTDDFLDVTFTVGQPQHVFLVGKYDTANTGTMLCGAANTMRMWRSGATTMSCYSGTQVNCNSVTPTAWHVHEIQFNGASFVYKEDNVQKATGNVGTDALSGVRIGALADGSQPAAVSIAEIFVVGGSIMSSDRAAVHYNVLKTRYGL